jgi:uncharacterized protein YjbI with pentapeptide repeats
MGVRHEAGHGHEAERAVLRIEQNLYPGDEGVIREAAAQGQIIDLAGCTARGLNLSGLSLPGLIARKANLQLCTFHESDLTGADFSYARLDQVEARSARFTRAAFARARGAGVVFDGADLTEADLTWAVFPAISLRQAELNGTMLQHAHIPRAQLQGADATNLRAGIVRAEFSDWSCATLRDAHLPLADLRGAILAHCDVTGLKAFDAKATAVDVTGTDLTRAHSLPADLVGAHSDQFRRHRSLQEVLANPTYWDTAILEQEGLDGLYRRQERRLGG